MDTVKELMERDPHKLSDQDITKIIEEMRKGERAFKKGDLTAGNISRKKKPVVNTKIDITSLLS